MKNKFRQALLDQELTLGAWMQIGHPAGAEILARLGFDWVCVDLEHAAIELETMTSIFRALDAFDCVPLARLPYNDTIWIKRTLDAGARGLIVPMVNSAAEAERAVVEAKYPPRGRRGFGYSRANLHGLDFASAIAKANEELAVVVQIEHRDGIENLDEILAVDGVDAAFIGPMDLSGSYGKTGQMDDPEIVAALARFREGCRRRNKTAGMHLVHTGTVAIEQAKRDGYKMIALGVDGVFLAEAASAALAVAREEDEGDA